MKAPKFWYDKKSAPALLAPLAAIYTGMGRRHRRNSSSRKLSIPVICIGNIVSGGSGKTPTATSLLKLIQDNKISLSPFFLTRGYRGKIEGPERVDDSHDSSLWGDEALLLSRHAPTIVSKNRYAGGVLAQDLGADLVIMDDGMQNYTIDKDLTFCVIDGSMGFGNGHVVPQGPLRQTLGDGFSLTDAVILIGEDTTEVTTSLPISKPLFKASLKTRADHTLSNETSYIAFCGIGYPVKFQKSLEEAGLKIVDFIPFGDHYSYSQKDLSALLGKAQNKKCALDYNGKRFRASA